MPTLRSLSTLLGVAGLVAASDALAEARAPLAVARGPGAESCPDAVELAELVANVRGGSRGVASSYRVAFERTANAYAASIVNTSDGSERRLSDEGSTCTALGRATAVTLALLLDAEPAPPSTEARVPAAVPAPAPASARPAPSAATAGARGAVTLQAGGALLLGVIRPAAPGLIGGAGIETGRFQVGLNALWTPPASTALGPGHVTTAFLGAKLDACLAAFTARELRVGACAGMLAGYVRGEAHGFTRNDASSRPWLGLTLDLTLRAPAAPLGLELGLSALVPVRRQDFQVDGVGIAYQSQPIGGLLWLRGFGAIPW